MPTGTEVEKVYSALLKKGYSKGKAARIAQSQTGEALATGRKPEQTPKHPVAAASTVVAPPPPPPKRPAHKGPEYALAAANEPPPGNDDAQMIRPSSERVTPSPGMQILQDLRQAREAREAGSQAASQASHQPSDQPGGQAEAPPRARRRLPVINVNRMAEPDRRYPEDVFSHD